MNCEKVRNRRWQVPRPRVPFILIQPDNGLVLEALKISLAVRFVGDPVGFLQSLGKGGLTGDRY